MIDDALEFAIRIFFEYFFFYTGEIVLFILTFGKRKPRWDYYLNERASKFVIFTEISMWIGFLSWFFIIGFVVKVFLIK
jgi:hypothetical protein